MIDMECMRKRGTGGLRYLYGGEGGWDARGGGGALARAPGSDLSDPAAPVTSSYRGGEGSHEVEAQ